MTSPQGHYEKSYMHLAHAEVMRDPQAQQNLLLAAAVEGLQGVLLAFLMSQPEQESPTVPEPPPEEPAPTEA